MMKKLRKKEHWKKPRVTQMLEKKEHSKCFLEKMIVVVKNMSNDKDICLMIKTYNWTKYKW